MTFCYSFLVNVSKDTGDLFLKLLKALADGDGILYHASSAFPLARPFLHVIDNEGLDLVKRILPKESRSP